MMQLAARPSRPWTTPPRIRVFIAEDDFELRTLLAARLERHGFEVVATEHAAKMLAELRDVAERPSEHPDVVVLDVRMPGISGLALLKAMRETGWETPVVMLTAFADADVLAAAQAHGASVVFDKPADLDDVCAAVELLARLHWE
jgi:DNA-binding response OmpR family regulator